VVFHPRFRSFKVRQVRVLRAFFAAFDVESEDHVFLSVLVDDDLGGDMAVTMAWSVGCGRVVVECQGPVKVFQYLS
jgi:hypothetical protein